MAKRKADAIVAEEPPQTKKVKVANGANVKSGADKGVTSASPSDASTSKAVNATAPSVQAENGGKGKEKAVDAGTDVAEDVMDEDRHQEEAAEESDSEGDPEDEAFESGPSLLKPTSTHRIRKLAPRRPYPTVPTSMSATGPRSAHTEGKNFICITRRTPLGAYLRRCKEVIMKDGYVINYVRYIF